MTKYRGFEIVEDGNGLFWAVDVADPEFALGPFQYEDDAVSEVDNYYGNSDSGSY